MNFATTAPKRMTARHTSPCSAGCGHAIEPGQWMLYSRGVSRHVECPTGPVAPAAQVSRPAPKRIAVEDQGVYVMADGRIVQVRATRDKQRTYALLWREIGGTRVTEAGTFVNGDYEYQAGLVSEVAESGRKMTLEEAKRFAVRYGRCIRCRRHLKAAESVERALGPVCVKYFREP